MIRRAAWIPVLSYFLINASTWAAPATAEAPAHARSIGVMLGMTSADHDVGSGIGFGVQGSYFFTESVGAGLTLLGGDHDHGINQFAYFFEGLYRLNDSLPGLQVGALLGATRFSAGEGESGFNVAYGFKAAYDYVLPSQGDYRISIGAQVPIYWVKPGDSILTVIDPMFTAKLWF